MFCRFLVLVVTLWSGFTYAIQDTPSPLFTLRDCEAQLQSSWGVQARRSARKWLRATRTMTFDIQHGENLEIPKEPFFLLYNLFKSPRRLELEEVERLHDEMSFQRDDFLNTFEMPSPASPALTALEAAALRIPRGEDLSLDRLRVQWQPQNPDRVDLVVKNRGREVSRIPLPLSGLEIAVRNTPVWWQFLHWYNGAPLDNRDETFRKFMRDSAVVLLFSEDKRFAFAFRRDFTHRFPETVRPFKLEVWSVYPCDRRVTEDDKIFLPDVGGSGRIKKAFVPTSLRLEHN